MKKSNKNNPWRKFNLKKNNTCTARDIKGCYSIYRSESQRGMRRDFLTGALPSKQIMDNETLSQQ